MIPHRRMAIPIVPLCPPAPLESLIFPQEHLAFTAGADLLRVFCPDLFKNRQPVKLTEYFIPHVLAGPPKDRLKDCLLLTNPDVFGAEKVLGVAHDFVDESRKLVGIQSGRRRALGTHVHEIRRTAHQATPRHALSNLGPRHRGNGSFCARGHLAHRTRPHIFRFYDSIFRIVRYISHVFVVRFDDDRLIER